MHHADHRQHDLTPEEMERRRDKNRQRRERRRVRFQAEREPADWMPPVQPTYLQRLAILRDQHLQEYLRLQETIEDLRGGYTDGLRLRHFLNGWPHSMNAQDLKEGLLQEFEISPPD
ncbi:hypothetical protein BGZ94_008459 [Podila epigama]|nr:hypothetical protein BGZ94_008459 [Podila epigama]